VRQHRHQLERQRRARWLGDGDGRRQPEPARHDRRHAAERRDRVLPGVTLGVDGFLWNGDSFTLSVPLSPAVVGFTFSAQGFELAPAGAPCLGQISLTDTVDVTIG
jgi:hypothetical protein